MLRPENVAMPAAAATGPPPNSVPPDGLATIASDTWPVKPVAVLPNGSRAVTCTAGVIVAPAVALDGCTVKNKSLAGAGVMLNPVDVVPGTPVAVAPSV